MLHLIFDPYPLLHTDRLQLARLSDNDAADILELRSDERVNRYIYRDPMQNETEARAFIAKIQGNIEARSNYYWAIRLRQTPQLIGTCCLFHLDEQERSAELGYELLPAFQGLGLMREAVGAVCRFATDTLNVQRLDAWIHRDNAASLRLAAHFGFERNAELESRHRDLPELQTMQIYSRRTGER